MIITILLLIVFAVALITGIRCINVKAKQKKSDEPREYTEEINFLACVCGGAIVSTIVLFCLGSFYTQSVGEVRVIKNWTGTINSVSEDAGLHMKMPWQKCIVYDTRNSMINFYGNAEYTYEGGNATGAALTINDKSGVNANIDIQVEYSLNGDKAKELYENYGTQSSFTEKYLTNDLRAVARTVASKYDTMQLLVERATFAKDVETALKTRWIEKGITVEQVNVQAVNYEASIVNAYADAQAANIAKEKALREQEVAEINAETAKKVAEIDAETALIKAQGEAEANEVLAKSLTSLVVLNKAAENGCLVISDGKTAVTAR